jgi:sugar/nucleoside kinase (ribokinase family)
MLSRLMESGSGMESRLGGEQLRGIMTYANAAGALACTKRGVIPALPTAGQVRELLSASRATEA